MCTIVFPEVAAKKLICSPSANTLALGQKIACFGLLRDRLLLTLRGPIAQLLVERGKLWKVGW